MLKLPNLSWFMGMLAFRGEGNIYSGSAGCNPFSGNDESKTFRYRVWIEKEENGYILKAVYYFGLYSYDATDKDIMTVKTFDATQDGILQAENWLGIAINSAIERFTQNN